MNHQEALGAAEDAWEDALEAEYPSPMAAAVAVYFVERGWPDPAGLELERETGAKRIVGRRRVIQPSLVPGTYVRWVSPWREVDE